MLITSLRPTKRKAQGRVKVLRQPKVVQREDERLQHL